MPDTLFEITTVAAALVAFILLLSARKVVMIYAPNVGLLYRNGKFQRELGPGRYAIFDPLSRTRVVKVSRAPVPVPLPEFTVLSKDQFSFRVGVSPIPEIVDARAFVESQPVEEPRFSQHLPPVTSHEALRSLTASAVMETVGKHTLRELFAEPKLLTEGVRSKLAGAIPGALIDKVLLVSITLPPETRRMFTDVERSKMAAEASLERARGEQAALRALANAARLVRDNPALANLRFLQMIEQAPGQKTIVIGSSSLPLAVNPTENVGTA